MNLQTMLEFAARLVPNGEPGDYCRSGDYEVHVSEKESGDREIVVYQRVGSVDMDAFEPDGDGE